MVLLQQQTWKQDPEQCMADIVEVVEPILKRTCFRHVLRVYYHLSLSNIYASMQQYSKAVDHTHKVIQLISNIFPLNFGEFSTYFQMLGASYEALSATTAVAANPVEQAAALKSACEAYTTAKKIAEISTGEESHWSIFLEECAARTRLMTSSNPNCLKTLARTIPQADLSEMIPIKTATPALLEQVIIGASQNGNWGRLAMALSAYGNPPNFADVHGKSPLIYATMKESVKCVELLLQAGANVNARDRNHATAISFASFTLNLQILKMLVAAGANVNVRQKDGSTPLTICTASDAHNKSQAKKLECAQFLLESEADPNVGSPFLPLHNAAVEGNIPLLKSLLAYGALINAKDSKYGYTALHYAVLGNNKDLVWHLLVDKHIDVFAVSSDGSTPHSLAELSDNADFMKIFKEYKFNKQLCNMCGISATQYCGGCKQVLYCGKEHQKQDWVKHKKYCIKHKSAQ
jgi:ankyrin repeat protein